MQSNTINLRLGTELVGTYLIRIGVMETPESWWSRAQKQNIVHFFTRNVKDGEENKES